jgi:acyl-CoA thioester hydrolase
MSGSTSIEPDRWRPADSAVAPRFRYVGRLEVRFRDLDVLGHVNHVVYLTYVEQVRTAYFLEIAGIGVPNGLPWAWVIASVSCDYLQPLSFGDVVDVGWRIGRLGQASADYEFELVRGGEVVGRGSGALVNADPRAGRSVPIPDAWRAAIAAFEGIEPRTARSTN